MTLAISGSGVAVYPPGATFGPRRLPDFEFVWLLQGTAEWRYDQGSIALGTNCLLLGRPGMRDSFVWDRARPTRHAYLHFRLEGRLPGLPDPALWPLVRRLPDDDPLRPLLRYLLKVGEDRSTEEVLRVLLTLFVRGPLPDRDDERLPPPLEGLLELVRRGWSPRAPTRPLPLQELAAAACISPGYLSRVFRHHYGIGPVAAIADDCGFANPYHFSRRFHWVYGQPPGRYRRAPTRLEPNEPLARAGLLPLADRIWRTT